MDMKALYHSLKKEGVTGIVEEYMYNSGMVVNGVDWKEMGKYLVVLCGNEGLEGCDLQDILLRRAKGPRKLGITYLDKDVDANKEDKWNWSRDLDVLLVENRRKG